MFEVTLSLPLPSKIPLAFWTDVAHDTIHQHRIAHEWILVDGNQAQQTWVTVLVPLVQQDSENVLNRIYFAIFHNFIGEIPH
jgi:hypothetical protein